MSPQSFVPGGKRLIIIANSDLTFDLDQEAWPNMNSFWLVDSSQHSPQKWHGTPLNSQPNTYVIIIITY